jgi:hypothetical protein
MLSRTVLMVAITWVDGNPGSEFTGKERAQSFGVRSAEFVKFEVAWSEETKLLSWEKTISRR